MQNRQRRKPQSRLATKIKSKKRGIKDEWQLFDSGQFEEVGNDTRNVYSGRLDIILEWCRTDIYTHNGSPHEFIFRNNLVVTAGTYCEFSRVPCAKLS